MKKTAAISAATASLVLSLAIALPAAFGSETGHLVRCADSTGATPVARSFDTRITERTGGKAHAIELFKQKHPGGHCRAVTTPHPDRD